VPIRLTQTPTTYGLDGGSDRDRLIGRNRPVAALPGWDSIRKECAHERSFPSRTGRPGLAFGLMWRLQVGRSMSETRKIAAILVSDVVGYSRLAGTDEDRTLSRLRGLRSDLIDPAVAAHHGRIVKRTGDGSLIEFRSVVDAVRCAIEVQNGLVERNTGLPPERRIEFRVGIHLGDVVEEADGDVMGDGVNIAARLEGIAAPGAICLSEDAYRQVKGRLDLAVTDLGPTRLKNIVEPIRVYSLQVSVPVQAKPVEPVTPVTPAAPTPQKRRFGLAPLAAALAALMVVIAGGAWWALNANRPASVAAKTPAEAARLSIVVLPFANLSGDPGQDYLVDALTDELTTSLARFRDSFVIAHNTALTFKGKPVDAKAVGKDLGVRYVLEGSVQPSGDRMRVNAQLIDAGSGAHLWAEQFDTPRADPLQTQDAIVAHLANTLNLQLEQAYLAGVKRTPAANRDAEDLALQCSHGQVKAGSIGTEADAAFALCEQALAIDPNNVRALTALGVKFFLPVATGVSGDPKGDLERADELVTKALALDPDWTASHDAKGGILRAQGRPEEAVAEDERALALDPSDVYAAGGLGFDYERLGEFDKSVEYLDKAIRASPYDPRLRFWYASKTWDNFGLKRYDQAIELARQTIAIKPNYNPDSHLALVAALALTGHDGEAREALQRYLALPSTGPLKTIAAWKAHQMSLGNDPRFVEMNDRTYEGLRKAGMPEE
jgi:adenylate cyclase